MDDGAKNSADILWLLLCLWKNAFDSWTWTVGERELGDEGLRAEDDNRGIGYFDRDGDTGGIREHGGPDA
jgi:hypothetical protein